MLGANLAGLATPWPAHDRATVFAQARTTEAIGGPLGEIPASAPELSAPGLETSWARASAAEQPDLLIEAGQDGPEEGVLDESADDLQRAGVWAVDRSGDIDLRRDLLALPVLEEPGDAPDHALVQLFQDGLVAVLRCVVDLHVLEEGLDVSAHGPLVDLDLRVEGEDA